MGVFWGHFGGSSRTALGLRVRRPGKSRINRKDSKILKNTRNFINPNIKKVPNISKQYQKYDMSDTFLIFWVLFLIFGPMMFF